MSWTVPVADRVDGQPVYDLVLLTRHPDGLWLFNDAASRAYFKHHQLSWSSNEQLEQPLTLFGELTVDEVCDQLHSQFAERVAVNLSAAVERGESFVVKRRMDDVFADGLAGRAGEKHVRSALRRLYEAQVIGAPDPKGKDIAGYRVTPGPAVSR